MRDSDPCTRGPFESEIFEGIVVIALPHVLSAINRDHVPAAVLHYVRQELCHFVVDCGACEQLAPSALRMLAEMRDIVRAYHGEMLLAGVGPAVQREILRAGLGSAFAVLLEREEAIEALRVRRSAVAPPLHTAHAA